MDWLRSLMRRSNSCGSTSRWRASASRASTRSERIFSRLLAGQRRAGVGDVGARTVALVNDPFALQFQIGAGHGVGIDQQLMGQHTDGRDFVPRRQPARGDQIFDLVGDLQIDRNTVAR